VLGGKVNDQVERFKMNTELPVRHLEYLGEVEVNVPEGFKSGLVIFGKCTEPRRVLRISLKYSVPGREFFDGLLERFKARFGKPVEWKGDPFHVHMAWKWSFIDGDGNRISMILQHYSGDDEDVKRGNSVKLSMPGLIEKEGRCFESRQLGGRAREDAKDVPKAGSRLNFETLIPN
jgi:hypothetical protein